MDENTHTALKWGTVIAILIGGGLLVSFVPLDQNQTLILGVGIFILLFLLLGSEIEIGRYV